MPSQQELGAFFKWLLDPPKIIGTNGKPTWCNWWPRHARGPVPTGLESQRRKIKRTDGGSRFSLDSGHLDDLSLANALRNCVSLQDVFPKLRLCQVYQDANSTCSPRNAGAEVMFGSFDPPVPAPPDQSHSAVGKGWYLHIAPLKIAPFHNPKTSQART